MQLFLQVDRQGKSSDHKEASLLKIDRLQGNFGHTRSNEAMTRSCQERLT